MLVASTVLEVCSRLTLFGTLFVLFLPSRPGDPQGLGFRLAPLIAAIAGTLGVFRTLWRGEILRRTLDDLWARVLDAAARHRIADLATAKERGRAAALADATFEIASSRAFAMPDLAGALGALFFVVIAVIARLGVVWVFAGLGAAAAALLLLAPSRQRTRQARQTAWEGHMQVAKLLDVMLSGASELRGSGRERPMREKIQRIAGVVARAERDGTRYAAVLALLPVLFGGVLLVVPRSWLESIAGMKLGEAGVLATAGASFVLAAMSSYEAVLRARPLWATFTEFERAAKDPARTQRGPAPPITEDTVRSIALEEATVRYEGSNRDALPRLTVKLDGPGGLAFVGPNGAGKTTALMVIAGLVAPTDGLVIVNGAPVDDGSWEPFRSRILVLPQRPYLAPEEPIAWHVGFFGTRELEDAALNQALERVGLLDRLNERRNHNDGLHSPGDTSIGALSTGEQRRVLLARAFVEEVDLIVLDEPEAGLDAEGRANLARLLDALAQEHLVLVAVHDQSVLPKNFTTIPLRAHETGGVEDGRAPDAEYPG